MRAVTLRVPSAVQLANKAHLVVLGFVGHLHLHGAPFLCLCTWALSVPDFQLGNTSYACGMAAQPKATVLGLLEA